MVSEDETLEKSDEHKNIILSDSIKEKTLRSELKGQVLRHLTKDTVVILDGLNYIKGFRYELYCASKSVKTTQVTVHCDISPPTAWAWNESREDGKNKWSKETFDALVMRYEVSSSSKVAPDMNRTLFEGVNQGIIVKYPYPTIFLVSRLMKSCCE